MEQRLGKMENMLKVSIYNYRTEREEKNSYSEVKFKPVHRESQNHIMVWAGRDL